MVANPDLPGEVRISCFLPVSLTNYVNRRSELLTFYDCALARTIKPDIETFKFEVIGNFNRLPNLIF
jgi:hypothetical protein